MDETPMLRTLLVQARLNWKNPAENRAHLENHLAQCEHAFDLAVFPETFTTGFLGDPDLPSEAMDGPTVDWLRRQSQLYDSALAGSAVITEGGKRYNRFLFATPDGEVRHYDKRHLFGYGGETERYSAGHHRVVWTYREWRICPQVCYDLRFPVWCRNRGDYDLLLFVANWPRGRVQHWISLLQARAIENQAWVVGVNRVGEDGKGVNYPGHSQVYDPLGVLTADLGEKEESRLLTLDRGEVARNRATFPFQDDADPFDMAPI